jgi:membrane-associated phospholipid phosphatase
LKEILKQHFNYYFFVPFLLWVVLGCFLLFSFDSTALFSFINGHHYPFLDTLMELLNRLGEGWVITLLALCFFLLKPFRNSWFFMAAALSNILPALLTQLIKYQIDAPRPMSLYDGQPWVHHLAHWDLLHNNSFPSGHTTGAFSLMCLLACVMPRRLRFLGILFFILALSVAYARVYLAAHFFLDIYIGSIIGAMSAFMIMLVVFYFKAKKGNQLNHK